MSLIFECHLVLIKDNNPWRNSNMLEKEAVFPLWLVFAPGGSEIGLKSRGSELSPISDAGAIPQQAHCNFETNIFFFFNFGQIHSKILQFDTNAFYILRQSQFIN